ncbi:MAG: hypothetical protein HY000_29815 [Planctomycetes bacterium]|nr:hypothetical protein [Planctomycetota bacterium]
MNRDVSLSVSSPTMSLDRRSLLKWGAAAFATTAATELASGKSLAAEGDKPTEFQIACMTLPYSQFPLERALTGLKNAGYRYVAWGTQHVETGKERMPVMPVDAPPERAKELAARCRDLGLDPVMMFSTIYPEDSKGLEVLTHRIRQAAAAGIPQVLTFGHTEGGHGPV